MPRGPGELASEVQLGSAPRIRRQVQQVFLFRVALTFSPYRHPATSKGGIPGGNLGTASVSVRPAPCAPWADGGEIVIGQSRPSMARINLACRMVELVN
jgi:hypothetical protein